ncbi:MAG: hypothetical protein ACD_46C00601G0003 [uncultured bacterium]|nr:MAG: hypothetical protein ACD_46C00601G0003 [uncultured bacterium]
MLIFILFLTGLFAGTVDAIAGGGGLISIPMLLSVGIPPHLAFGTNKLQGTIGTFNAARRYYQQGWISLEKIYMGVISGLIGSVFGSILSQILSSDLLKKIIPILLFCILIYTFFSPTLGVKDENPRLNEKVFYIIFGLILGFYDGFLGPGVGSIWVFFLTFFLGFNLIKATAYTKIFNLNSSFISLICFAIGGNIDYKIGFCMAAGQFIGGRLGANLAIKNGAAIIRPLFLSTVSVTILALIYKVYARPNLLSSFVWQQHLFSMILIITFILLGIMFVYYKIHLRQFKNEIPT